MLCLGYLLGNSSLGGMFAKSKQAKGLLANDKLATGTM